MYETCAQTQMKLKLDLKYSDIKIVWTEKIENVDTSCVEKVLFKILSVNFLLIRLYDLDHKVYSFISE